MARKTTKKKTSKRNPEQAERNKRIAITSGVIICAGGVFVGATMGIGRLNDKASEFILTTSPRLEISWPTNEDSTSWMPIIEQDRITKLLERSVAGGHALTQAPLKEAGLALLGTGWVNGVPVERWTSDGTISVEPDWRRPIAAVRVANREYIIDKDRHLLPLDYPIGASNQFFFINPGAPLPDEGENWVGTDLEDGVKLLMTLSSEHLLEQIAGIDFGEGKQAGTMHLITTRNARIVWGAGPGRERPGEVPMNTKIDRLRVLFERTGLIDAGASLIDIRTKDILFQRKEG